MVALKQPRLGQVHRVRGGVSEGDENVETRREIIVRQCAVGYVPVALRSTREGRRTAMASS